MKYEFSFGCDVAVLPARILRERLNECSHTELRLICAMACDPALLCEYDEKADALAASFGVDRKELDEALAFWRGAGAIATAGNSAVSAKRSVKPASSLHYTGEELADIIEKNGLLKVIDECERLLGKTFNPTDINTIVNLYHNLGVEQKYISTVCAYCVDMGKKSLSYLFKTACALYDQGIVTVEQLDEYVAFRHRCAEFGSKLRTLFGIGSRALTAKESKSFENWLNWGFGEDIITRAYEITIEKTGKYTISYIDKILTNWHTTGYTTLEEIDEAQSRYSESKKEETKGSFDTDDFFERALKRSMDNAVNLTKNKTNEDKT